MWSQPDFRNISLRFKPNTIAAHQMAQHHIIRKHLTQFAFTFRLHRSLASEFESSQGERIWVAQVALDLHLHFIAELNVTAYKVFKFTNRDYFAYKEFERARRQHWALLSRSFIFSGGLMPELNNRTVRRKHSILGVDVHESPILSLDENVYRSQPSLAGFTLSYLFESL